MRNKTLDQSRLIAAFMVVLIHSPLPYFFGGIFESLARFAVPFFFMISGYYATSNREKLKKSIKKTAWLLLWSVVMYFVWELAWSLYRHNTADMIKECFSPKALIDTLVFNNGALLGHLWFILALLYCYLIYIAIFTKASSRVKLVVGISLLILSFTLREILRGSGISDTTHYTRNFLFTGIPFFLIGNVISEKWTDLSKIKSGYFVCVLALGVVATVAERFLYSISDLYIGTVLISIGFFVLSVKKNLPTLEFLSETGRKYASDIYVFHVMIIGAINVLCSVLGLLTNTVFLFARPIIVLVLSIIIALVKEKILEFIKNKKRTI